MNKQRFKALWDRCRSSAGGTDGGAVFDELVREYSGRGRHYHTPGHIDHCLRQFDAAVGHMDDPNAVEVALWFHDVIYDAAACDNERKSADLFLRHAGDSMDQAFKDKVVDLIMVTIHREPPESLDEKFIVDIDLSSFGLPWDEMLRDSIAVRDEMRHLSDGEFFPKQRAFLQGLLDRDRFCFTDFFRDRHEKQARENIAKLIKWIDERSGTVPNS